MRLFIQSVAAIAVLTATASAQPAPPPATVEPSTSGWTVLAGYEVFALRDISRNGRPPDASPMTGMRRLTIPTPAIGTPSHWG